MDSDEGVHLAREMVARLAALPLRTLTVCLSGRCSSAAVLAIPTKHQQTLVASWRNPRDQQGCLGRIAIYVQHIIHHQYAA